MASKTSNGTNSTFPHASTRHRDFVIGEVYHIFQRGTQGAKVFASDVERGAYLEQFFLLCRRHSVRVHNFVLMTTHIHFVLEPETTIGISKVMQELQGPHTRQHNKLVNKKGNMWTQHYGCKHVNSPEYYRKLMWYVENNPVRSGRCRSAEKYKWSGALAHAANRNITFKVETRSIKTDLYLDRWREMFLYTEKDRCNWVGYLRSDALTNEMLNKIEAPVDKRSRKQFANEERVQKLAAIKKAEREYKYFVDKVGPGRAMQIMAEARKQVEMRAMSPHGDKVDGPAGVAIGTG